MSNPKKPEALPDEDLEGADGEPLPDREMMSIISYERPVPFDAPEPVDPPVEGDPGPAPE